MAETTKRHSDRVLVWIGLGVLLLLVAGGVVAFNRGEPEFEPGSPEAAVQGYVQAVLEGDATAALGYLSDDLQQRCDIEMLRRAWFSDTVRVVIVDRQVGDDRARIDIEIRELYGEAPFGVDETRFEETIVLERTSGAWRISEPPWPIYFCPEGATP